MRSIRLLGIFLNLSGLFILGVPSETLRRTVDQIESNNSIEIYNSTEDIIDVSESKGYFKDTGCKIVETVPDFDIDVYVAKPWYSHQQAETADRPASRHHCVRIRYAAKTTASLLRYTFAVHDRARDASGNPADLRHCAYQTDPTGADRSKLAVAPCYLPRFAASPRWVVAYDEADGYALVSGGQPAWPAEEPGEGCTNGRGLVNAGLWILLRTPERDEGLIRRVRDLAREKGFDLSVLRDVDQERCEMCEDDTGKIKAWWGGERDCAWVGAEVRSGRIRCHLYGDFCPNTCERCEEY